MSFILWMAAMAVAIVLWNKVQALEARLRTLEDGADWPFAEPFEAAAEAAPSESIAATAPISELPRAPARVVSSSAPIDPLTIDEVLDDERRDDAYDSPRIRFDLEDLFGRLLPIWAGGLTLAVAGFFIVRFSIEAGLLTPAVRVIMGFAFGLALLGGAEAAYRWRERVSDPRVGQALSGAGLATLYASFLLAGTVYGLVGTGVAFVGLAAVTAAAIGLSFRFGLPSAILGLVGGFAAPAMVGAAEPNVPLLATYLALVVAGLSYTGRQLRWAWLGSAALAGGFGWGMLLLANSLVAPADLLSAGLYLLILGVVIPRLAGGRSWWMDVGAASLAALQMAVLVADGNFGFLAWSLYLLLAAALAVLGWRDVALRRANIPATVIGIALLGLWWSPTASGFGAVAAVLTLIAAGFPLALLWRGRASDLDVAQLCGAALGIAGVSAATFSTGVDAIEPGLALTVASIGVLPLLGAWRLWADEHREWHLLALAATGSLIAFAAAMIAGPAWSAPIVAALIATGVTTLAGQRRESPLRGLAWAALAVAVLGLFITPGSAEQLYRLVGGDDVIVPLQAALRWSAVAIAAAWLAWRDPRPAYRKTGETLAALAAYGVAAQLLDGDALAWLAAVAALAVAFRWPARSAVIVTLAVVASAWAIEPLLIWLVAAADATVGGVLYTGELPSLRATALHMIPALGGLALLMRHGRGDHEGKWRLVLIGLAMMVVHTLYRHLIAFDSPAAFERFGLLERTVWEGLLLLAAFVAGRLGKPGIERALAAASLAHFAWFSLLLHNPLWTSQAVGALPIVNLVLAMFAMAIAATLLLRRGFSGHRARVAADGAVMLLVTLFAMFELRQLFAGSIWVGQEVGDAENLLRSLAGILLALGFLLWGMRRGQRSWRIGSLVLMVVAVLKVFLLDAAGLDGLLRIGSFVALGFSLIGIGWLYSRQLARAPAAGG